MYNSFEERALINALTANHEVPSVVVGIGSNIPETASEEHARRKFGLANPYIVYVGRIDANKGCAELFAFFAQYSETAARPLDLVLIGTPVIQIPRHPRIRHLGHVDDQDKFDTMAGARALVMPSYYESLSMVALEAWALGRPVLVNAHCDVLLGQCQRSNAGLYYETAEDFAGALDAILDDPSLAEALGERGRRYFAEHYRWPVIERKYLNMFQQISTDPPTHDMEPIPGHFERRRRDCPSALDVLRRLPSGPVRLKATAGHQS
jgi:glycosyltransferase involved in cell wall biosynthesis